MNNITPHVQKYLGCEVKDKVTNIQGIVVSVCFDLNGCTQVLIDPKINKEGSKQDVFWTDTSRLEIINDFSIIPQPEF